MTDDPAMVGASVLLDCIAQGGDTGALARAEIQRRLAPATPPTTDVIEAGERAREAATDALILSHARLRCALEMIAAGHGCPMALADDTLRATLSPSPVEADAFERAADHAITETIELIAKTSGTLFVMHADMRRAIVESAIRNLKGEKA